MPQLNYNTGIHFRADSEKGLYLPEHLNDRQLVVYNIGFFGSMDLDFSSDLRDGLQNEGLEVGYASSTDARSRLAEGGIKPNSDRVLQEVVAEIAAPENYSANVVVVDMIKNTQKSRKRFTEALSEELHPEEFMTVGVVHHATARASKDRVASWVDTGRLDADEFKRNTGIKPSRMVGATSGSSIEKPNERTKEEGVFIHVNSMNFDTGVIYEREDIVSGAVNVLTRLNAA